MSRAVLLSETNHIIAISCLAHAIASPIIEQGGARYVRPRAHGTRFTRVRHCLWNGCDEFRGRGPESDKVPINPPIYK
jgi:hypothetical protein